MPVRPGPRTIAAEVRNALRAAADSKVAAQGQTYFKEAVVLMGVRALEMRRIARETYQQVKPHWTLKEALALCNNVLPDPRLEVKGVAVLVCERFGKEFEPRLLPTVRDWIERGDCDSWAIIDALCSSILGPLLGRFPDLIEETTTWTASPNRWLRRAAAVSLTKMARRGQMLDRVYRVAERLLDDRDNLVCKANGWLLRDAGHTDPVRLEAFLRKHGPRLSGTTLRYAIEHFPKEKRVVLLSDTRQPRT